MRRRDFIKRSFAIIAGCVAYVYCPGNTKEDWIVLEIDLKLITAAARSQLEFSI